jgi:hypothetical protein
MFLTTGLITPRSPNAECFGSSLISTTTGRGISGRDARGADADELNVLCTNFSELMSSNVISWGISGISGTGAEI